MSLEKQKLRKKYLLLSMALLMPIIAGCRTTASVELPPKPQRQEQKSPENMADVAELLNYYEHLVQQWESWGKAVDELNSEKPR